MMRSHYFFHSAVLISLVAAACADNAGDDTPNTGGTGSGASGGSGPGPVGGTAGKAASGGNGTGGSVTGGTGTGGTVTGGTGTGGTATGGTGTGGTATGGTGTGGTATGGTGTGGTVAGGTGAGGAGGTGSGGTGAGGSTAAGTGGTGTAGSDTGGAGSGGGAPSGMGPCDIYEAASPSAPCVGAYSTIRRIRAAYTGPLFQVRSGSNAMNTGSGGETHDIAQTDGYALQSTVDAACGSGTCTVSLIYDQSGRENHLKVAKRGLTNGGMYAGMDDFETVINVAQAKIKVSGKDVYSLYMAARQGYRQTVEGDGVPLGRESQGLYMLADGTHTGDACCWDFGNVSPDPTRYGVMNTLFLGKAYWGRGAGSGPWYMADFEAGVWAGGTDPGDPGWGALDGDHPINPANPSIRVKYALGFLKTNQNDWALRMADAGTATTVSTAYAGGLPKAMANEGAIVLGVGGDNSNNSWGTFYEGAVLAGFPPDSAELAVLQNIKAVGYGN